jgi:tetratricopeptide (TPR) repeat protein
MRHVCGVLLVLASIFLSPTCSAQEEEAVTVFDRVSPSIVGIESVASSGTGVLLDAKGTILTNAHVVALQLPLKCLIDVRKGAKYETNTYRKVTIVGIHPKLDLALIKIDPAENPGTLVPAAINHAAPKTGQRVYAIGNPGAKGQVKLTKTVTSGILSGVDRVIEDVSYFQFSAPINPGNSGGPLCDKAGKIIGLVTMKLPDLDNVGFAIPLQDIKSAEFKPFAERPKDTVKSGKMITAGNNYIDQLNKVRRRPGGGDSPQALILRILALDCMHEALLLDPTNGSIYMSIGDLADEFEEYEVAEEYFRAGISASPWHNDPRIYRTYGRHKLRMKKPDEAEAIWWEGIARHPHLAGLIWEDLAILYQAKGDYQQSAVCACAASMLKSPGSRPEVALRVGDQSVNKITDPAVRAKTLEQVAGMAEEMFRRVWQRKLLLGQKRAHLTPAFGAYAQKIGIKLDGSLTAAARPFVIPAFDQRLTDIATSASPGQPGLGAAWKKQDAALVSPATAVGRLDGQSALPEEYDLMISAERLSGKDEIVVGFEYQGQAAAVILDFGGSKSGFAGLKSPLYREAVLPKGEFVSLLVQVRKKTVSVRANEKEILSVATDGRLPEVPEKWGGVSAPKLFIATQSSALALHAWQLVKLPPPPAQSPPPAAR